MRITTRGEYAVRVLLELGMRNGEDVSLNDIAKRWRISLDYLEQLMPPLKKAGLVRSRRGAKGGYSLAKSSEDITVADILEAFDGSYNPTDGIPNGQGVSDACVIRDVWEEVKKAVDGVLRGVTLAELVEKQKKTMMMKREAAVYHI